MDSSSDSNLIQLETSSVGSTTAEVWKSGEVDVRTPPPEGHTVGALHNAIGGNENAEDVGDNEEMLKRLDDRAVKVEPRTSGEPPGARDR